jgi:triacylglycerol esterase/lipase EstA (alpha/beta hydrolase family)
LRNQGYATNRCDYIGHSMGGCVLRYALDHYNNHFYRSGSSSNLDYKNYGRGYVNKTITINTPHNSSPWADILNRYTPDLTVAMRVALGLDYGSFPNSLPFSLSKWITSTHQFQLFQLFLLYVICKLTKTKVE